MTQVRGSSTHLSRRRTGIEARNHIVDFRGGRAKPSSTIMHCMLFGRFDGLKEKEGKGKERKGRKRRDVTSGPIL